MTSLADLPSPHPKRLPNSAEIRQCKVAIAELDQNMQNILSQIQKLEEPLEDLAQRRANYASYIASFRRLPVEILSEIVVLSVQNGTSILTLTSIHSSLRDAILGMSSLWRSIRLLRNTGHELPFVYDTWDKTVSCSTGEQLDVILSRTGSVPLRLKLYGPVKDGTLELLSSRRSLIESLTSVYYDPWILPTHRFLGLNFSTLRELHINDYLDDIQVLMNIALQSTQDDFELYLSLERSGSKVAFFTHQLMQRVTLLQISFGQSINICTNANP
ncbi:hypothetical protein CPB86DRAFT_626007 [Serendipita vermifera]|nr:hypothetical protein CPB86DRAFT_626007 [Serendipita vermifera]